MRAPAWFIVLAFIIWFLAGCYNPRIQLEQTVWRDANTPEQDHRPTTVGVRVDHTNWKSFNAFSKLEHSSDIDVSEKDEISENVWRVGLEWCWCD